MAYVFNFEARFPVWRCELNLPLIHIEGNLSLNKIVLRKKYPIGKGVIAKDV